MRGASARRGSGIILASEERLHGAEAALMRRCRGVSTPLPRERRVSTARERRHRGVRHSGVGGAWEGRQGYHRGVGGA